MITLRFAGCLGSWAAKALFEFQRDKMIQSPNLAALIINEILQ